MSRLSAARILHVQCNMELDIVQTRLVNQLDAWVPTAVDWKGVTSIHNTETYISKRSKTMNIPEMTTRTSGYLGIRLKLRLNTGSRTALCPAQSVGGRLR